MFALRYWGERETAVTAAAVSETLKEFGEARADWPVSHQEFEVAKSALLRQYPQTSSEVLGVAVVGLDSGVRPALALPPYSCAAGEWRVAVAGRLEDADSACRSRRAWV